MKKSLAVFILCISATISVRGQEKQLDSLISKFNQYREKALQEKIYAHLDRTFLLTGETFWFKIYNVDGSFHKPLGISKVAYAEVLDSDNFAVLQAKIELNNGIGNGSFFLPATLSSGHYKFRVYTSWMKNYHPEFYFNQVLTIVNPFVAPGKMPAQTASAFRLDFFPEGGNLVSGLQSKIGFRVSDDTGKGSSCNGFIVNDRGDTLTSFAPLKFGIGHFYLTPLDREKYKAILIDPSGNSKVYALPEVHPSGYVMHLRDSGDHLYVAVATKNTADKKVFLFAHARQIISRAEMQPLHNGNAAFIFAKKELSEGISHFTLFNEELQPVCERLYFVYPSKKLHIDISGNQKIFTPRKKVTISLNSMKNPGEPVPANLSLSVSKIDSLPGVHPMGIFSYLWLGSDLSGRIESPKYYFETSGPQARAAMDNLMLTHGWRRFDWKDVLENHATFQFLPELRDHIITGVITKDEQSQRGVFTHLGSPGKIIRAYGSWSNARGEVRFEIKDFYGPRRIILQTNTDSTQSFDIKIIDPFSSSLDQEKLPFLRLGEDLKEELTARSIAMQVQDIYYYEQYGKRMVTPTVDSSAFYGQADATYYLDDYTRFPIMEEVMREYVPGVFVRKRKDGFHFLVVDKLNKGILDGDPMVLLDGVPILDVDDVMKIDPLRVKKLEVIQRTYFLGQAVFSGIVSYTTYNGDLGGLQLDPRSVSLNYDGLQLKRQFHSPQYNRNQANDRMPDQRYLLYWDADIMTDEQGRHQVEFYTSDIPGRYEVVVEGLSKEGLSGTETYTFSIVPPDIQ